jgi:hypothetical protein
MKKIRGEISTEQIVLLIILLVSFIIILFLLFGLNLGKESDSEICHNSVAMRGASPAVKDSVPLKCSRTYVCLTKDGSCEKMTKPEIKKVTTKEEVYHVLAEEMANCWWMFGEGKVDYIGKDFFIRDNYCSICSQIAFDNSLKDIEGVGTTISKDELYTYLSKTPMPNSEINYAEYLFGTNAIDNLKKQTFTGEDGSKTTPKTFGTINPDKQYFVIMGITSEVNGNVWKTVALVGVSVAGFFLPGAGWTLAGAILGTLIWQYGEEVAAIIVPGNGIKNNFMAPTIQEANSASLKELNCYDIVTST